MILKLNVDGSVERVECSDESVWNVCRKELNGDLPLGKEVQFEEWFVSQQTKGESK